MNKQIENYISFFSDQIREEIEEQEKKNRSTMSQLFKTDVLSLGYIERVLPELGIVIIKFPHRMAPRLNVQRSITIIKKAARRELGDKVTEWTCLWGCFCNNVDYHSAGSDIMPLYYVSGKDNDYDYIACTGLSLKMYDLFLKSTTEGKSLSVIIFDSFPPIEYYRNLIHYMEMNPEDTNLYLEPKIQYEDWTPEELAFDEEKPDNIAKTIERTIDADSICIVQGPPGTGKSYNIATIVAWYLSKGKSVCVTTMANKGLVELIKQKPLAPFVKEGRVSKTNLSADERIQIKGVKDAANNLWTTPGELICATNYVLSSVFSEKRMNKSALPQYDLIVIEEASQAFLTTISAFITLAKHRLIVGDPMQLAPIVKTTNPLYNAWNVNTQVEGLTTFALGSKVKTYRIVTTFRLTTRSAAVTKLFYGNRFVSVRENYEDYSLTGSALFPNEGGVLFYSTGDIRNGVYSEVADRMIHKIVELLEIHYPNRKLAIITPFKDTVRELQKRFATSDMAIDITIETIDRIQGMTVDYAIMYLPCRNPSFALQDKRFNVGTSRSSSTTLIISDQPLAELRNFHSVSKQVLQFLYNCEQIDENGKVLNTEQSKMKVDISSPTNTNTNTNTTTTMKKATSSKPTIGVHVVGYVDLSKFERQKKELSESKINYYIVDTNVFVNCPDIILKINKNYPIILSAKVIDELDKMKIKLDEKGKLNAEKALRLLNGNKDHKIIYEFADTSLLPEDYEKRSPDNMILSVALKYRNENPIILTSDNGLQVKSKACGISTISLRNFLNR